MTKGMYRTLVGSKFVEKLTIPKCVTVTCWLVGRCTVIGSMWYEVKCVREDDMWSVALESGIQGVLKWVLVVHTIDSILPETRVVYVELDEMCLTLKLHLVAVELKPVELDIAKVKNKIL